MSSPSEAETSVHRKISLWRDVGRALRGRQYDYTREPLNRAILLLAAPMVLETLAESLFALVATFWVSGLGRDAIAVVGLTESIMTVIYAVAVGIAIAAAAVISRRVGERQSERAAQSAAQIVIIAAAASAVLGLVLGYFAVDVLRLMGAAPSAVETGASYARIMFGANATVFMIFVINAIFRGSGDVALAMRTLWLANALNIALAPCFIHGWGAFPELGVTGAAVATNIGRGVGVIYQLWHLCGDRCRTRVSWRHFQPRPDVLLLVLRTSASAIAQLSIGTVSWIALIKILATFGSAVIAGYTITIRIVLFVLLPAGALAGAAATLVGQNLGANRADRAEAAVRIATLVSMVALAALGLVFGVLSQPIVHLFTSDPEVLAHAVRALTIFSFAMPLYAVGICLAAAFNGAGDTWTPTRTSFICLWLGQVPLAWLLANGFRLGPLGVFIAVPVSISTLAIWNYVLFTRGEWKEQKI